MKRDKIIYWVATGLVAGMTAVSSLMYLSKNPEVINEFEDAGYPDYFITLLGIAKLLGAIALVAPMWDKVKEWAYAGFTFTFIGAAWTHIATNTPFVSPLVALVLIGISYWSYARLSVARPISEENRDKGVWPAFK